MIRQSVTPRPDSAAKLESIGFSFHNWDDYWKEDVCYKLTLTQVEVLEAATEELHQMCLTAVEHILKNKRLGEMGIPDAYWPAIEKSFKDEAFTLYGRFDFAYDGINPPKMLEYNADTPTSLLESAVAQWYWMEDVFPREDQFNSLHDKLVARWRDAPGKGPIYVASLKDNEEDEVCTMYLADTILQAGREARHIYIEDIGWDAKAKVFVDLENRPIETLFKLYPWEWLMREDFGPLILESKTQFIEPIWKAILSCKALLPILWELFPGHPNLLPAYFEPGHLSAYAKKPLFSREGANVSLYRADQLVAEDEGPYGAEGYVYQALCALPEFEGRYPVIGAWVVGAEAAGICIREDVSPITTNMSHFVPHYFVEELSC
jgi:glutathionylspermidine synthase